MDRRGPLTGLGPTATPRGVGALHAFSAPGVCSWPALDEEGRGCGSVYRQENRGADWPSLIQAPHSARPRQVPREARELSCEQL